MVRSTLSICHSRLARSVKYLSVFLDTELNMTCQINRIAGDCFFQLRRLSQLRNVISPQALQRVVSALILSRLDYCNSVLAGLAASTLAPLQRVQNAAARLVAGLGPRDHVTPALSTLHWLPVVQRIQYKLCVYLRTQLSTSTVRPISKSCSYLSLNYPFVQRIHSCSMSHE